MAVGMGYVAGSGSRLLAFVAFVHMRVIVGEAYFAE